MSRWFRAVFAAHADCEARYGHLTAFLDPELHRYVSVQNY